MLLGGRVPHLVWIVPLFLVSRLVYLTLVHPDSLFILPEDELYQGTVAKELLSGLHQPFFEYRADNYNGGSLVVSLITACFFHLFGPTVFALKLTPLLFFALALGLWFQLLQRQVGERVALYFAAIFICSPPLFTSYSLTVIFHSETIVLTSLSLFLFTRMMSEQNCPRSYPAWLGLTAGFSLWFSYIYGLTLLTLLLIWAWLDRTFYRTTRFALFAAGCAIGFSPWLILNAQNGFLGLVVQDNMMWDHFGIGYLLAPFSDFRSFAPYQFLATLAWDGPNPSQRWLINGVYAVLFLTPLVASLAVARRTSSRTQEEKPARGRTLTTFGLTFLGLFFLAVQASDFKAPRYNMVAYPFVFFFLAHAVVGLQERLPLLRHGIRTLFLCSLFAAGVVTHSFLFSADGRGFAFSAKGYSYAELLGFQLCRDNNLACDDIILPNLERTTYLPSIFSELAPADRYEMSISLVDLLAILVPFDQEPIDLRRLQRLIPPDFDKQFYYLLGRTAPYRLPNDLPKALRAVEFLRGQSASFHRLAVLGVLDTWPEPRVRPEVWPTAPAPEALLAVPASLADEHLPCYWRAAGHYAARFWYGSAHSLDRVRLQAPALAARLPAEARGYYWQGVGRFLFNRWQMRPVFTLPFRSQDIERFPVEAQPALYEGIGMGLSELQLFSRLAWMRDPRIIWLTTTAGLSEREVAHLLEGWRQFAALFEDPDHPAAPIAERGERVRRCCG